MNKHLILTLLLLFIFPGGLFSQALKKVKKFYAPVNAQASYHVLKSDKAVMHGAYALVNGRGELISKGQYDHNQKVGAWDYYRVSSVTIEKYTFDHDQDTLLYYGIALRINELGSVVKQFDFKPLDPPEGPIAMEDLIMPFYVDFINAFLLEYKNANLEKFRGKVFLKLTCTEQQVIGNPVIVNNIPDYYENQIKIIANKILKRHQQHQVFFIDKKGHSAKGEMVIPLNFQ